MALQRPTDRKPLPKWMWWIAGLFLFAVVSFLIFLFINEGASRAKWDQFRAEWEAKGEVFEWAAFIPPPIPDVENLAMAPVMRDLKAIEVAQFRLIKGFKVSKQPGWADGKARDLTVLFPSLSKEEAAKTIAAAMDERAELLAQITSATRERTKYRFPLDYALGVRFDIKPVAGVRGLAALCLQRSRWFHSQGKIDQSFEDWITAAHISNALGTGPSQLGFMIHHGAFHHSIQSIWELLHSHQLNASQLKEAQAILADQNFIVRFLEQTRIERALVVHGLDQLILGNESVAQVWGTNSPLFNHYPKGWWYEDKRTFCDRQNRAYLYPNGVKAVDTLDIAHCKQIEMAIAQEIRADITARVLPKNISSNMAASSISSFAASALHAETHLRLLRLAFILEQYYQKHQQFPQSLARLTPELLETIPLDPVDQQALRYRPEPNGKGYVLYGVGTNVTDDGGTKTEDNEGDWVWPMPRTP